jgi:hypothetical protein
MKPTVPDINILIKFDANTAANRHNTKAIPSFGMADRATDKKANNRNGNTNISKSFRSTLIVRKNLIASVDKYE